MAMLLVGPYDSALIFEEIPGTVNAKNRLLCE
jgi:hypothetical protein